MNVISQWLAMTDAERQSYIDEAAANAKHLTIIPDEFPPMSDAAAYEEERLRELAERGDYLGDGVYASFDGYQVWVKAQRDSIEHAVALERGVLVNLLTYARNFYGNHL